MLKQMLELSDINFRKFLKEAPNSFFKFSVRVFAQCNQWQCSSQQTVTKKSRGLISAVIIKGNKSEEKAIYFGEKMRTYQGNRILVQ